MTVHPSPATAPQEPPAPIRTVRTVGLLGVGLVTAALVFGLVTGAPLRGFETHWADGPRALLAILGLVVAGCAVSMRPGWYGGWLCGAAAGAIGYGVGRPPPDGTGWYISPPRDWYAAVPNAWDSVQLFFGVAAAIGLVGAAFTLLPRRAVLALVLAGVAFHFTGILSAITSPSPTPFLTDQYWRRVAREYLMFAYFNNAYQFYSPDPGPACEIWACVHYKQPGAVDDDPDAPKECAWVYIPKREAHHKDPLGLTFYRRLALSERLAQYVSRNYRLPPAEATAVERRRQTEDARIPRFGYAEGQRAIPNDLVIRQILPTFARHLAWANARPGWEVKGVKIYRTLHVITTLDQFVGFDSNLNGPTAPRSPYSPMLYLPYYQGEFDPAGRLKDPESPMLYWLVPLIETSVPPASRDEFKKEGGFRHYYIDYLSIHAGCARPVE